MGDRTAIRFLDPVHGDIPCAKSRGHWRMVVDDLCVCRACDEPAITCYAKLGAYGELSPFYMGHARDSRTCDLQAAQRPSLALREILRESGLVSRIDTGALSM